MKQELTYTYAVIEDIEEVRAAILSRVDRFKNWRCVISTPSFAVASSEIERLKPELLFLDYAILGGNSFMLLDQIKTMVQYSPYIVFFTAYMSDQPQIAEQLLNRYSDTVDFYLNKPIFSKLDQHLERILSEAHYKTRNQFEENVIWIKSMDGKTTQVSAEKITCFSQSLYSRNKIIHLENKIEYEIKATWQYCENLIKDSGQVFFFANSRHYFVNLKQIIEINRPFIRLRDGNKIEVTKDRWTSFRKALLAFQGDKK